VIPHGVVSAFLSKMHCFRGSRERGMVPIREELLCTGRSEDGVSLFRPCPCGVLARKTFQRSSEQHAVGSPAKLSFIDQVVDVR
jgi:hypothetical protein